MSVAMMTSSSLTTWLLMERKPASDDDTQDTTMSNLKMKRRRQSSELQVILSQSAVFWKQNYYKRNIFWSLMVKMVKRGCSANDTIDEIYQAYMDTGQV